MGAGRLHSAGGGEGVRDRLKMRGESEVTRVHKPPPCFVGVHTRSRDAISPLSDTAVARAPQHARVALRSSPAFQPMRLALRTMAFAFETALQTRS